MFLLKCPELKCFSIRSSLRIHTACFHFLRDMIISSCLVRCSVSGCECHLRTGQEESSQLLVFGSHFLQAHDQLHQQLDAHQDHQTGVLISPNSDVVLELRIFSFFLSIVLIVLIVLSLQFGALTPLEPRLGKKLVEPLTNLVHTTTAMSLLYECICTVIVGMPNHNASMQLCVSKLRLFIEDSDQNLKYLGLLAMAKILQHQPKLLNQHRFIELNFIIVQLIAALY